MYQKNASLFLQIIQYTNLAIIMVFLILFTYRFYSLSFHSLTDKFKNYFPKTRIFFCLAYVLLSTSLITYNIATDSYSEQIWYQYVLQGGGGQCIDSVILIIQLGVLRLQLKKQQPYTRFHIWYFIYLMIMSLARFIITIVDTINGVNDLANTIISALLVVDSVGQFAYWIKNRQSLPDFINPSHEEIDSSRYHSQIFQKKAQITKRSLHGAVNDQFPYINVFVSINNGKIRIDLERIQYKHPYGAHQDESGLNESFLDRETNLFQEFLTSNQFTLDQIKKFYTICGRFQLKKQLNFSLDLRYFVKQLQLFFNQMFLEKKCYTTNILKFLKIPENAIQIYQNILQKLYLVEYKGAIDMNTGLQIIEDKNAIFCSINLYRFMWVYDHYEYYMRVALKEGGLYSYPIKRMQQIEQWFHLIKKMVKIEGKHIDLPQFPKMHTFMVRDDDSLQQSLKQLQIFLRKLLNQQAIMQDHNLKEKVLQFLGYERQANISARYNKQFYAGLKIVKGRISKALINNEYITLYQFKLLMGGSEVRSIMKRFRQIQQLHHDIQRWIKNRKGVMDFSLPEKVVIKPEIRHQKLKNYLQNVLELKDIFKCYPASVFFDARPNEDITQSSVSCKTEQNIRQPRYTFNNANLITDLQYQDVQNSLRASNSSKNFSKIIDDMGNEQYD